MRALQTSRTEQRALPTPLKWTKLVVATAGQPSRMNRPVSSRRIEPQRTASLAKCAMLPSMTLNNFDNHRADWIDMQQTMYQLRL